MHQSEIARAVVEDVLRQLGGVFTVEMAEGVGRRELSTQVLAFLLALHLCDGGRLLAIAPQGVDDDQKRLTEHLNEGNLRGLWSTRPGIVRIGHAEWRHADIHETRSISRRVALIETFEAQSYTRAEYEHLLALGRRTGATSVLYGLSWRGLTASEETERRNRELEATGASRRHFRVTWEQAAGLPGYLGQVAAVRARLSKAHPEFRARYALRPLQPTEPLFSGGQNEHWEGPCARTRAPAAGLPTQASGQLRSLFERALGRQPVAWVEGGEGGESERLLRLVAAINTGRLVLYAGDSSVEYWALRYEMESALIDYTQAGLVKLRFPQRDHGFLRGLPLLTGRREKRFANRRWDVLEPALAS